MTELTIKELHKVLGDLICMGHGDKEFQIWYDSETCYTSIPKASEVTVTSEYVRFSDYEVSKPDIITVLKMMGIVYDKDWREDND